jgi:metallophosphoesterase (TIGR00282 family)
MKILHIGDVVGKPGRNILREKLGALKQSLGVDFTIINGENAAGGSGLTAACHKDLVAAGADCITTGDHVWKKKEIVQVMELDKRVLRPLNYPPDSPGKGWDLFETPDGTPVVVALIIGRIFMGAADCPFRAADKLVKEAAARAKVIVIDIHAEATSEKIALGRYLDGRVSAVIGTHTHVATADEQVLPGGTAYITDVGMTGPHESVIGRRMDRVIEKFITNFPRSFDVARGDVRINGVLVDIDETTGRARSIKRVMETYD